MAAIPKDVDIVVRIDEEQLRRLEQATAQVSNATRFERLLHTEKAFEYLLSITPCTCPSAIVPRINGLHIDSCQIAVAINMASGLPVSPNPPR